MNKNAAIFVAGHNGMVGSAIVRRLRQQGYFNLVIRSRQQLDLTRQSAVENFFSEQAVEIVIMAAARVGGIHANSTYPAEFIYQNLIIECNVIQAAHQAGIDRLLFLGSSCIYPALASQPMNEESLLQGKLETTNEPYAIAKIAGIKLCESFNRQYGRDYRSVMPTNLYGPQDNFHLENSHVIPALLRRFHESRQQGRKTIEVWGSGRPRREFLHVDDMAAASLFVLETGTSAYQGATEPMLSHINVGTGADCTIADLAAVIAEVVGFDGDILFDTTKPDGPPQKLLDVSRLTHLGWRATISLEQGLKDTYAWYLQNQENRA